MFIKYLLNWFFNLSLIFMYFPIYLLTYLLTYCLLFIQLFIYLNICCYVYFSFLIYLSTFSTFIQLLKHSLVYLLIYLLCFSVFIYWCVWLFMYLVFIYLCTYLYINLLCILSQVCGTLSIICDQCTLHYLIKTWFLWFRDWEGNRVSLVF